MSNDYRLKNDFSFHELWSIWYKHQVHGENDISDEV